MASIIKNQILKHLSKFAKNLSHDRIGLSLLKGEGNLTDLELDEDVLMDVLELPSWINLKKAVCNKVSVKIPWTKLKTNPIHVYFDMVEVQLETCRTLRKPTSSGNEQMPAQMTSAGKYGFAEKVLDGMYIHVNSVSGTFVSDTFHADIQIAQVVVQSKTPEWELADLRMCRVKDMNRGEVITFKEVEWSTLRLLIDATENDGTKTTPIRLITNQGKVRVSLKKRLDDCSLVSSRLQVLLDDILWVLTDSQLKAVILHFRSLFPVIQKATELSKARASTKAQTVPPPRPVTNDPANRPHNVKSSKELQMVQFFEKYDVIETSYHLFTRHIDLHLCDEMNQTAEEWAKRRIDGGAMQVSLNGFSLDYYPFHVASSNRNHWEYFDEAMKISDKWIHTLLAHFKQQYASTRKQLEKRHRLARTPSAASTPQKDKGQKETKSPRESKDDNSLPGLILGDTLVAADEDGSHDALESDKASDDGSFKQSKSASNTPQDKGQSSKGQGSSKQPPMPKQSVKLMSHGAVLRIRDFKFNCVQTGKNRTESQASGQQVLLKSDKATFCLPEEMPSLHIEYLSFYFPNELDFPVPSPVAFVQLNPVQFKLDYTSVLWLNQFVSNVLQTLPDTDTFVPEREGRDHMDIRFDSLMPTIIMPAECPVEGQPDRPQELRIQISQLTATNCRTGTSSPRPELSRLLQHFQGMKLYQNMTSFPNQTDDLTPLPQLFWQHAYEPNFYIPKECQLRLSNHDLTPNGSVPGSPRTLHEDQDLPATDLGMVKLTTHSFRPDAVNDIWSIKIEQIWADFHGMASSKDRPVPLLDPFTLNIWACWPSKDLPPSVSQSQSRTDVGNADQLESAPHKPINANRPLFNDENSPPGSVGSRGSSGGNVNSSFEDLSVGGDAGSVMGSSRSSDAEGDGESYRQVLRSSSRTSVLSPLESETSTVIGGSDHTLASKLGADSLADAHYIVQAPGQIKLTVQHYQVLFLLRLQASLQQLMTDIESDQSMYSSKPLPPATKAVAFCCPVVEANLILNPIPDPDADNDSIATSAHGEYQDSTLVEGQNDQSQKLFDVGYDESANSENDLSGQLPKIVMDKMPPDSSHFKRTSSQSSVPNLFQGGPPGAVVMKEDDEAHRSRSASIPARQYFNDDDRERRKSQELELAQSTIPTIQTSPQLTPTEGTNHMTAHRSSSDTGLNRMVPSPQGTGHQLSFNTMGSLMSLDDSASGDLDIMSIDSDSSEGFAAMRLERSSIASSSQGGLEIESESGLGSETSRSLSVSSEHLRVMTMFQNPGVQNPSPVPSATSDSGISTAIPIEEQFKDNKHKLKTVSMVTFNLVNVDTAVQLLGLDSATKVQVQKLERDEKGNMDYNKLLSMPPAARKTSPKLEQKPIEGEPLLYLRFQSGPKAEKLAETAGERGILQLQVNGLDQEMLMSTITHVSSLTSDEIASEPMPLVIHLNQANVVLQDDALPPYPTFPGNALPLKLDIPCLTLNRNHDGVFHITGAPSKSSRKEEHDICDENPASTPSASTPSNMYKTENVQLRSQLAMMKDALNVLEHERSSLLSTLEHLQEELLTADRQRDTLQYTITDLQRQVNIR